MKINVYGGCYDGIHRIIVAAGSYKQAHALVKNYVPLSYSYYCQRTSITGNRAECAVALAEPFEVFKQDARNNTGAPFIKVT